MKDIFEDAIYLENKHAKLIPLDVENTKVLADIAYDKRLNKIAGSSRYDLIDPVCKSIEIGWIWYGREFPAPVSIKPVNSYCSNMRLTLSAPIE